jgi:acyl-CoA thioesterase YciA
MMSMAAPEKTKELPSGVLAVKVIAMPCDTNADGDVFGGWILSNMDAAAALIARDRAKTRVATVAIHNMSFHKPCSVGDCVEYWGEVVKVGNTSITVKIQTWVERRKNRLREKVTEGEFVFVALDDFRKPIAVDRE